MKYAQTRFSSVANHCPETSLFLLTKAESYFLAPDPPNFQLISRLCAVDLTHAGTARFSSRNERPAANSYCILKLCSLEREGKRSSRAAGTAWWLAPSAERGGTGTHCWNYFWMLCQAQDINCTMFLNVLERLPFEWHPPFRCVQ